MINLNYLMDHIIYQIFKTKLGYYIELLTPETMILLGSTESKVTKDKNDEKITHLEIIEVN